MQIVRFDHTFVFDRKIRFIELGLSNQYRHAYVYHPCVYNVFMRLTNCDLVEFG